MLAAQRNFAPRGAHGTNACGRRGKSGGRNFILRSGIYSAGVDSMTEPNSSQVLPLNFASCTASIG